MANLWSIEAYIPQDRVFPRGFFKPCVPYVTGFGKIRLNAANNFFQYPRVKPYGSIFFEKIFMAEMDRHQLALAYDAVVSSGVLSNSH